MPVMKKRLVVTAVVITLEVMVLVMKKRLVQTTVEVMVLVMK